MLEVVIGLELCELCLFLGLVAFLGPFMSWEKMRGNGPESWRLLFMTGAAVSLE